MKHNWKKISKKAEKYVEANGPFETFVEMYTELGVAKSTLQDAITKGWFPDGLVAPSPEDRDGVTYTANEAIARYNSAERLSAEDMIALSGIDMSVFYLDDIEHTAWTTTRKDIKKDITWQNGAPDDGSFTSDTGGLVSKYNWRVKAVFKRREPVAVRPSLQPIVINARHELPTGKPARKSDKIRTILFLSDTHFGYVGDTAIHSQPFLGALLNLASIIRPHMTIHGGDVLDLAGFSSFQQTPKQMFKLQKSAIECAWWLQRMRLCTDEFPMLEGNHDQRVDRKIVADIAEAHEVRPVNDLDGPPMFSIPRLLGLAEMDIEWIDEYTKNNSLIIGRTKFIHGSKSNSGIGKTTANLGNRAAHSLFYGHTHRPEGGWGRDELTNDRIFIGCPGGCVTTNAPGAKYDSNWALGAFLIHLDIERGVPVFVEPITGEDDGTTWFRGDIVRPYDYREELTDDINRPEYTWV